MDWRSFPLCRCMAARTTKSRPPATGNVEAPRGRTARGRMRGSAPATRCGTGAVRTRRTAAASWSSVDVPGAQPRLATAGVRHRQPGQVQRGEVRRGIASSPRRGFRIVGANPPRRLHLHRRSAYAAASCAIAAFSEASAEVRAAVSALRLLCSVVSAASLAAVSAASVCVRSGGTTEPTEPPVRV